MIIDIQDLKTKRGKTTDYFFQQNLGDLENTNMLTTKEDKNTLVNVKVYAFFADSKVFVSGNLKTWITTYCSRCLKPFKQEVKGEFWEEFKVNLNLEETFESSNDLSLSVEAANELEIKGSFLDLREYIRQLFIVFQEWKPLCDPDCQGICSECGVNLNEATCTCIQEAIDPRLAPLKELQAGTGNGIRRN